MSKNPTLVLVLGFIAGCGAAAVAPLVVPPARAQTTPRWSVYCAAHRGGTANRWAEEATTRGNAAGEQGWELVSADGTIGVMCFKRPAP
jgi:hypothetical protein